MNLDRKNNFRYSSGDINSLSNSTCILILSKLYHRVDVNKEHSYQGTNTQSDFGEITEANKSAGFMPVLSWS